MTYTPPNTYFNRFDRSKNYSRLLFLAGQGLQGAELNEIQEFIRNDLTIISRFLVANGTVTSGGEVSALTETGITIKQATVWADGHAVEVPQTTVTITASGVELVGMATKTVMITELEDPAITEPDPASPAYGQPGSYRERTEGRWCKSTQVTGDETFFPIITLTNGVITSVVRQTDDPSTLFNQLLNQYDYEVQGNYLLRGMQVTYKETDVSGSIILNVSSGKARVLGTPITQTVEKTVALDPINDIRQALGEPYTYAGNATYNLRYNPVKDIIRVQGTKEVSRTITHGAFSGSIDSLPDTPVLSIVSVSQGATNYTATTDYTLSGDSLDWSPGGAEPAPGSTYTVVYRYISTFSAVPSVDGLGVVLDSSNILVTGSTFYVDYNYYLRRIDRLNLSNNGLFVVNRGTPGYNVYQPSVKPSNMLSLATIELVFGHTPIVKLDTTTNVNLDQLNAIIKRVSDLEFNVSTLSLLDNARSTDPTTNKRGVFVDPCRNNTYLDLGQTNNIAVYKEQIIIKPNLSVLGTTANDLTLTFTETEHMRQDWITANRKINPYALSTDPRLAEIQATPGTITQQRWWYNWWNDSAPAATTVASTSLLVNLRMFDANELVNVSYLGTTVATTVNGTGAADLSITIPAGISNGTYAITAVGVTSGATAQCTFAVSIIVTPIGAPPPPPPPPPLTAWDIIMLLLPWSDPIAQTFQELEGADITSIFLNVTELPQDDIIVKLCGLKYGIPDKDDLISTARIAKNSVTLGWNKITFQRPGALTPGEYSFIILTSKPQGSVSVAKLGQRDNNKNKFMQSQPHTGVFLVSANESTWTPVQDEDLSFITNRAVYSTVPVTSTLFSLTGQVNVSDWMLTGSTRVPNGTTVRFFLEDSVGNQYDIALNEPLITPGLSGNVALKMTMSTNNARRAPIVYRGLVLLGGQPDKPAVYTARQVLIPNGTVTPSNLKLIINEYKPTGTTVTPQVQLANNSWSNMTFSSATPIGDGWSESIYTFSSLSANATRLRVNLDTSNVAVRPIVTRIRLNIT